jgi:L-ascorbate peroxidase
MADLQGIFHAFVVSIRADYYIYMLVNLCIEYLQALLKATRFLSAHLSLQSVLLAAVTLVTASLIFSFAYKPMQDAWFRYCLLSCWKDLSNMMEHSHCQPVLLRLAFADAANYDQSVSDWPYCGGVNGSIRFDSELEESFNAGLGKAIALLAPFKRRYPTISWADLIQMAGAVAVYTTGGPLLHLQYGRVDVPVDMKELNVEEEKELMQRFAPQCILRLNSSDMRSRPLPKVYPPYPLNEPSADSHLRTICYRLGFSNREIVALCGAHTIGRAFQDRSGVCPFSSGDQGATSYTKLTSSAHGQREVSHSGVGMAGGCSWTKNWLEFDNAYFRRPLDDPHNRELLWLPTDQALLDSPEFKKHFLEFAQDQSAFFEAYAQAHKKMSKLGAKYNRCAFISP